MQRKTTETREKYKSKTAKYMQATSVNSWYFNRSRLPLLIGQIFQSYPPSLRYVFLSKLPNEGLRDALLLQESTMGADHHTLLTPRKHDIRPSLVLHEPRTLSPDDGNDDVVLFIPLEGVDVEHSVFPREICGLQGALDRVALGIVGSDYFERFLFFDVPTGHLDDGFDFSWVLSMQQPDVNHKRRVRVCFVVDVPSS